MSDLLTQTMATPWSEDLSERSLVHDLRLQAQRTPQALALQWPQGRWNFAQLMQAVDRCARALSEQGVQPGDPVALVLGDEVLLVTAMLALASLSAPAMCMTRSSTSPQRQAWMRAAGIRFLLAHPDDGQDLPPAVTGLSSLALQQSVEARSEAGPSVLTSRSLPAPQGPMLIMVGSGSTGQSKLIPITHAQMRVRARSTAAMYRITASDRCASFTHTEYAAGMHRLLATLLVGGAFVLPDRERMEWRQWGPRDGVTVLSATVLHAHQMLKELADGEPPPLQGMRLTVGSSVVSDTLRHQITTRLCPQLWVNYGTNEAWTATLTVPQDALAHPGTVGRALPDVRVEIHDDQGYRLPAGQTGHIAIASRMVVDGYLGDEAATRAAFRKGWFYPGDLGRFTDDGHLIFCGRSDNLMVFNGINIYPIEIERCLLAHPQVADAVAMPLRHAVHQDLPVALVSLRAQSTVNEAQLLDYAAAQLGARRPRRVLVLPEIARNPQGKPIKAILQQHLAGLSRPAVLPSQSWPSPLLVHFEPAPAANLQNFLTWQALLFPDLPAPRLAAAGPQALAQSWLQAQLRCVLGLMHLLRLPVFEPMQVLSCHAPSGANKRWRALISAPDTSLTPSPVVIGLLRKAMRLAQFLAGQTIDNDAARQRVYHWIACEVMRTYAQIPTRGKSTFAVSRAAHRLGVPCLMLPGGLCQLGWGAQARVLDRSGTDADSALGMLISQNKWITAQWLRQAALPAPVHEKVTTLAQAQAAAQRLGYPVVVKPADMERGEGVSVDVQAASLAPAFELAHQRSPGRLVLVEKQVPGVCHRVFVAGGQLLYAVRRLPMGFYADGVRTIAEQVQAHSAAQQRLPPWLRSGLMPLDAMASQALARQGWTAQSVPEAGVFVPLRRIESTAWGGVDEEVTDSMHPDNVQAALEAVRCMGLEVGGVDIISPDISQAWHTNGAVINEVNYAPLLGGGEISRRYLAAYIERLLPRGGLLDVHVFVGCTQAWAAAQAHWVRLREKGLGAWCCSHTQTLDDQGRPLVMPTIRLQDRLQALLMRRSVQALCVVVQSMQDLVDVQMLAARCQIHLLDVQDWLEDDPWAPLRPQEGQQLLQRLQGAKAFSLG